MPEGIFTFEEYIADNKILSLINRNLARSEDEELAIDNEKGPMTTIWMFIQKAYLENKFPISKSVHRELWDKEFEQETGRKYSFLNWYTIKFIVKKYLGKEFIL